jgi:hypothetical protein
MNGGGGEGCARGAVSQVISKWVTLRTETWGPAGQFAATTIAGGTTSVITGGKFATGAQTAAFGYLFNAMAHDRGTPAGYGPGSADGDHYYMVWTQLTTNCDAACVQAWSAASLQFSYPNFELRQTSTDFGGRPVVVYGPPPGRDALDPSNYVVPGGRVVQTLSLDGSVTNTTLRDHVFCCGTITRSLVTVGNSLYMMTVGSGYNVFPGTNIRSTWLANLNSSAGQQIFRSLDQQLIRHMGGPR